MTVFAHASLVLSSMGTATTVFTITGMVASFPGSPSFRAIIPRTTFDLPERKDEGEPGRFCHMILRHMTLRHKTIHVRHMT